MNNFHFLFEEMTITIDDMTSIFHISVTRATISFQQLKIDEANHILVQLLEVIGTEATIEMNKYRGPSIRLQWSRDNFKGVNDSSFKDDILLLGLFSCIY